MTVKTPVNRDLQHRNTVSRSKYRAYSISVARQEPKFKVKGQKIYPTRRQSTFHLVGPITSSASALMYILYHNSNVCDLCMWC